jgi:DNA-binding NtrC family response regulator
VVFRFCTGWDETAGAYSADLVVDSIHREKPDETLVLLDVMFGEVPLGKAILQRLRAEIPTLPVVMMTTEKPERSDREYLQLGAVDYLIKPLDARRFWRTVRRYLEGDVTQWLIGHQSLYQGAILTTALLAEDQKHLIVQGGTEHERAAFAYYAANCSRRTQCFSIDVREATEQELIERLFGRSIGLFARNIAPTPQGILADASGGVLRILGAEALPRGLQSLLARYVATHASGEAMAMFVAETAGSIFQLAEEDRFDRDFFNILNGGQAINIPPLIVRGTDLLHRWAIENNARTESGQAYDLEDEEALNEALGRVPVSEFNAWFNRTTVAIKGRPGQPIVTTLRERTTSHLLGSSDALPNYPAEMLERNVQAILRDIRLRELGMLVSAFEHANGNRARAASILKAVSLGRTSTLFFDRWFQQVWKTIESEDRDKLKQTNRTLKEVCSALGL